MQTHPLLFAALLDGQDLLLILTLVLVWLAAKRLPQIMSGFGQGLLHFRKELDDEAHSAGRSAAGIYGKAAAEALTPENQNAELYDPAVFRRQGQKASVAQRSRNLWSKVLDWLRIKR
jgi:Sec-independent protein translocase protein TatA